MGRDRAGLRILHVFRAPVGGLFRHVRDLARAQQADGHQVGLIADARAGGAAAEAALAELDAELSFGVLRVPMARQAGPGDVQAVRHVAAQARRLRPDVVHGHGAKGGAYARIAASPPTVRVYTPHGGSLHYSRRSPVGLFYLEAERLLARRTELFLFESAYAKEVFEARVAGTRGRARIVHNGLPESEFAHCPAAPDQVDFVFVGELRDLKGVGELLDALAMLHRRGRPVRAVIGGDGPDGAAFERKTDGLGLAGHVSFPGRRPAREFFSLGRCLVVPSRAESLPYIVLEAGAAGLPMIATRVGGIPEIFGPLADTLVPARNAEALAAAMERVLDEPGQTETAAAALKARIAEEFSLHRMTADILQAYRDALSRTSD